MYCEQNKDKKEHLSSLRMYIAYIYICIYIYKLLSLKTKAVELDAQQE
jgi:hypothetical protein